MRAAPAPGCRSPNLSACGSVYSGSRSAATRQPLRLAPGALSGALGPPGAARRSGCEGSVNLDEKVPPDGLLRHVVYLGKCEEKPGIEVRRDRPQLAKETLK